MFFDPKPVPTYTNPKGKVKKKYPPYPIKDVEELDKLSHIIQPTNPDKDVDNRKGFLS